MYSTIISGGLTGVQAYLIGVEVDIATGLPGFSMVGSLSNEVKESKERVQVALKNAGFQLPPMKLTVNLSPADRRKEGTGFDLPIAVGILGALGYFPENGTQNTLFIGELGLNGEVRPVRGILPIVREAAQKGVENCIIPFDNLMEGAVVPGVAVRGVKGIEELLSYLRKEAPQNEKILPRGRVDVNQLFTERQMSGMPDFAEVVGQESAKRAAEIAVAGFHNLLMTGPPGSGKSMIAKRMVGILPPLTLEESLELTSIMSVAGTLKPGEALATVRPFQSPHHTVSLPAMTGGCMNPRPGLISLSHRGILFLDELPEFPKKVLDSMRQPLEEHEIHISRVSGNVTYPADFMLVCAMNPCPCGYYPDFNRCKCTQFQVQRYMGKVSGPILDRIDLCVEVHPVDVGKLHTGVSAESSAVIRERVSKAREWQKRRFQNTGYRFNGDIEATDVEKFCPLGEPEREKLEQIAKSLQLSARAYHRILKVSRTIADLDQSERITMEHILEAVCYRPSADYWH